MIYLLDEDGAPPLGLAEASLDASERGRAAGYGPARRREFAIGRWLIKTALSRHGVAQPRVVGQEGEKPRLAGDGPRFSLSHTRGVWALAVGEGEVGVDIEPVRTPSGALREAALAEGEEAPSDEAFFRVWTAKEAYMKRAGRGLAIAPRRLRVDLARGVVLDLAAGSAHPFSWARLGGWVVSWL